MSRIFRRLLNGLRRLSVFMGMMSHMKLWIVIKYHNNECNKITLNTTHNLRLGVANWL